MGLALGKGQVIKAAGDRGQSGTLRRDSAKEVGH
jgi:hypothetical protein